MKTQLTAAPAFNYVGVKAKPNTAEQVTTNLNLNAKSAEEDIFELSAPQARSGAVSTWMKQLAILTALISPTLASCGESRIQEAAPNTATVVAKATPTLLTKLRCSAPIEQAVIGVTTPITENMATQKVAFEFKRKDEPLFRTIGYFTVGSPNSDAPCPVFEKNVNTAITKALEAGDKPIGLQVFLEQGSVSVTDPLERPIANPNNEAFRLVRQPRVAPGEKPLDIGVPLEGVTTDSEGNSSIFVKLDLDDPAAVVATPSPSATPTPTPSPSSPPKTN